jgi:hypothetical protein
MRRRVRQRDWVECSRAGAQQGRHRPDCSHTGCEGCYRPCDYTGRHRDDCNDDYCPGCSPRRADHGLLCQRCYDALEGAVEALPGDWAQLAERLAPRTSPLLVRVSGSKPQRLPIDPKVVELRKLIKYLLATWVLRVAEQRGVHRPPNADVEVTGPWLVTNLEWCAEQDWAGDMTTELEDAHRQARALLYPDDRKRVDVGRCLLQTDAGKPCPGTVRTHVGGPDGQPAPLICSANEAHRWGIVDYSRAAAKLDKAA